MLLLPIQMLFCNMRYPRFFSTDRSHARLFLIASGISNATIFNSFVVVFLYCVSGSASVRRVRSAMII